MFLYLLNVRDVRIDRIMNGVWCNFSLNEVACIEANATTIIL